MFNEDEYEISDQADAVLGSIEERAVQSRQADQRISDSITKAELRLAKANLYKLLITSPLFKEGSADQETIEAVTSEVSQFALQQLEFCLGIETAKPAQVAEKSPFDSEQIQALQVVADKVLKRDAKPVALQEFKPELNSINALSSRTATSSLQKINAKPEYKPSQPIQAQKKALPPKVTPKNGYARPNPNSKHKPIPMATPAQAMVAAGSVAPQMRLSTDGMSGAAVSDGNLLNTLVQQLTSDNALHVDNSTIEGEDINERF